MPEEKPGAHMMLVVPLDTGNRVFIDHILQIYAQGILRYQPLETARLLLIKEICSKLDVEGASFEEQEGFTIDEQGVHIVQEAFQFFLSLVPFFEEDETLKAALIDEAKTLQTHLHLHDVEQEVRGD